MKKFILIFTIFTTTLFSQSVTPAVFNIQGVLRTPTGKAANDGDYRFTFRLFDGASSVTRIGTWEETQTIKLTNGIYNALIGSVTSFSGLAFDRTYFVEIEVAGSVLQPRIQLTASPYALSLQGTNNKIPNSGAMQFDKDVWHKSSDNRERIKFQNNGKTNFKTGLEIDGNTEITGNSATLSLVGTDHSYIQYFPDGLAAGRKGYIGFPSASSDNILITNETSSGNISLIPSGTGKVGIGTSTPSATLDVNGTIKATNIMTKVAEISSANFNNSIITISGLDGNAHRKYKVFFDIQRDGGTDAWAYIVFNNSYNNYKGENLEKFHGGDWDAVYLSTAAYLNRNGWGQSGRFSGELTIFASSGKIRSVIGQSSFLNANNPTWAWVSYAWLNTNDNITSIVFGGGGPNWRDGTITVYAIP